MLELLPLNQELETKEIMRLVARARGALAELKGIANAMPNPKILINSLTLQEAKDSSEIENIITTNDEIFASNAPEHYFASLASKEVHHYNHALKTGFRQMTWRKYNIISEKLIKKIQSKIIGNDAGYRQSQNHLINNNGQLIYTPPPQYDVPKLMANLEKFINDNELSDCDPLIKMAIIHHRFETIHPFLDGNGRTGRIINILYLVQQGLLDSPILYLSRYINNHKSDYYRLLQQPRDTNQWHEWIVFMLTAVEKTALQTIDIVKNMTKIMQTHKKIMRSKKKIYSQELINNIFKHPYTKIEFVMKDLQISRPTAANKLDNLVDLGILTKHKIKNSNFYVNKQLYELLLNTPRL